jgi:outer membrane protein
MPIPREADGWNPNRSEESRAMSIFRLGAAAALCLLAVTPLAGQGTKVGYVNSDAILAAYGPAQEAQKSLEATVAGYRTEVDQLEAGFQQDWNEFQQQQLTMNANARRAREQEMAGRRSVIDQRAQVLNDQARQRQTQVFQPIMEKINTVLEEIRVEGGYGLILDAASSAILVADPALDLTQQVLTRLEAMSGSQSQGER